MVRVIRSGLAFLAWDLVFDQAGTGLFGLDALLEVGKFEELEV
jgi:hypothetical protein